MNIIMALRTDKKFKHKCLFTLLILIICRAFYAIPTPGINAGYFSDFIKTNSTLGLLNIMSGSAFSKMTFAAFGITPFISATIIVQIASIFIPALAELSKRKTIDDKKQMGRLTLLIGSVIAIVESLAFAIGFGQVGLLREYSPFYIILTAAIWTGTSVFISKMGQLITDKFIGNGISLILFINIVSGLPPEIMSVKSTFIDEVTGNGTVIRTVILMAIIFAVFYAAYFIQVTEKRIPVEYSGKVSNNESGKRLNYLPVKLCPGSVMPVIFAGTVFSIPAMLLSFTGVESGISDFFNTSAWFDKGHVVYTFGAIGYTALIFFFTFLYNNISANPVEIAEAIEKRGGTLADKRPGVETVLFIKKQTKGMLLVGCIFITAIALLPMALSGLLGVGRLSFLGTSVLIITGTIVETYKELFAASLASAERKRLEKGGLL